MPQEYGLLAIWMDTEMGVETPRVTCLHSALILIPDLVVGFPMAFVVACLR